MSFCEPYLWIPPSRSPFECFPPDNASYAEASHRFENYAPNPVENRPMHASRISNASRTLRASRHASRVLEHSGALH